YERTKALKGGAFVNKARLPDQYKKKNQFLEIVDIMRHSLGGGHLMDTFSHKPNQMTKSRMLELVTGSKNEPNDPEEFYSLQVSTLKLFKDDLDRLNSIVRSMR